MEPKTLLVTGFMPFGPNAVNPSWEAVDALPARIGAVRIEKLLLPVEFGTAAALAGRKAIGIRANAVLCVGLAASRTEVTPEAIGINLRDTTPELNNGNYAIRIPMVEGDFSFIDSLNENNWNYYLTNTNIQIAGEPANIMVIALSEDEFYVCYDGNIHIDEWAAVGNRIQGQVQNVKAFRVTREILPALVALPERATTLLSAYLPTVTFNGVISSARMTSENVSVIEALDQLQ